MNKMLYAICGKFVLNLVMYGVTEIDVWSECIKICLENLRDIGDRKSVV